MEQLEGKICVEAALRAHQRKIHLLILRSSLQPETSAPLIELAEERHIPVKQISREELDAMAHGHSHGGVLALCAPRPRLSADQLLNHLQNCGFPLFLLLLEGVDDSQNLGFVLRTAEACGVDAVLLKNISGISMARPSPAPPQGLLNACPSAFSTRWNPCSPGFRGSG